MVTTPVLDRIGRRAHVARRPDRRRRTHHRVGADPAPGAWQRGAREPGGGLEAPLPSRAAVEPFRADPRHLLRRHRRRTRPSGSRTRRRAACRTTSRRLPSRRRFPERKLVRIRQLGPARGGVINAKRARDDRCADVHRRLRAHAAWCCSPCSTAGCGGRRPGAPDGRAASAPSAPTTGLTRRASCRGRSPASSPCSGSLPFNKIQLAMSMPIDMKLDRLVLPLIVVRVAARLRRRRHGRAAAADDVGPRRARRCSWRARSSAWSSMPATSTRRSSSSSRSRSSRCWSPTSRCS